MALTPDEITGIADDAANLKTALTARGFGENAARDAVITAMPALVAVSTGVPKLAGIRHADQEDTIYRDPRLPGQAVPGER